MSASADGNGSAGALGWVCTGGNIGPGIAGYRSVASRDVCRVTAHIEVVRLTRTNLEEVVRLPPAEDIGCNTGLQPALIASEGQRINGAPREIVSYVVR